MTTQSINASLQIVKLKDQRFRVRGGYVMPDGYAFKHPELGFLAFNDKPDVPYTPLGGRNALQAILDAGGLLSFEDCSFIKAM